jgi:hypothetical protein
LRHGFERHLQDAVSPRDRDAHADVHAGPQPLGVREADADGERDHAAVVVSRRRREEDDAREGLAAQRIDADDGPQPRAHLRDVELAEVDADRQSVEIRDGHERCRGVDGRSSRCQKGGHGSGRGRANRQQPPVEPRYGEADPSRVDLELGE